MNTREYFVQCFKAERPKFIRVLSSIPHDRADYKPHPKNNSAADIAWLLACELGDACVVVDKGRVDFVLKDTPKNVGDSLAAYEKNANELEKRLPKLDDAAWGKKVQFVVDGNVAWETTLGDMLFGFLFDAVHHRGQLSSYLRPMGAKVPSIYGPSADDPGA